MRDRNRAVRILAKSVHRELREQGYDPREIVAFAAELIGRVADGMADGRARRRTRREPKPRPGRCPRPPGVWPAPPAGPLGLAAD